MAKRVAVVLSGCGFLDGSEIYEAVCTLLALNQQGANVQCFAPDKEQMDVVDHVEKKPCQGASRNVLKEAARLARGDIKPLKEARVSDFDAVVFPGGFGAAKNLCNYATKGVDCDVDPQVRGLIEGAYEAKKPICAICIAPVLLAKVLGNKGKDVGPVLTLGGEGDASKHAEAMGAKHKAATSEQVVVDEANRLVTTPAYMAAKGIAEVYDGIRKAVEKVLQMA